MATWKKFHRKAIVVEARQAHTWMAFETEEGRVLMLSKGDWLVKGKNGKITACSLCEFYDNFEPFKGK